MTEQVIAAANTPVNAPRQGAFKARMAAARAETGSRQLANQSLGRSLSEAETSFSVALMEVYAGGDVDQAAIAAALKARNIARPSSGDTDWSTESLEAELKALNAELDVAYTDNGFGA